MAEWTAEDPGAGDLDGLDAMRYELNHSASLAAELAPSLQSARSTMSSSWTGESASAWDAGVAIEITRMEHIGSVSTTCASAIASYVDAVEMIASRTAVQRGIIAETTSLARKRGYVVQSAVLTTAGTVVCTAPDAAGQIAADRLADQINTAAWVIHTLASEREATDQTFVTAIRDALGEWTAEAAAYRAIGLTDPTTMTSENIAVTLAQYTTSLLEQESDLTAEQVQTLSLFLRGHGADPNILGRYFVELGGERTGDLVNLLSGELSNHRRDGHEIPVTAITDLGALIRAALATGSARWTQSSGSRFARNLLDDQQRHGAAAFLFNGPPFLGKSLAISAAQYIDDFERLGGGRATSEYPLTRHSSTVYPNPGHDLAGRIFETLGQYPQGAHDFLRDSGAVRTRYWFGERNWAVYDGFTGPAALLEGAVRVPGGRFDPPLDLATHNAASEIVARALTALAGNESYRTDRLRDEAARTLARAVTPYLSDFADNPLSRDDRSGEPFLLGDEFSFQAPAIDEETLARVFGRLMGREASAHLINEAAALLVASDLSTALLTPDADARSTSMSRIAGLTGLIHGAGLGETIRAATQTSEATGKDRAAWEGALATIPVPGGPALSAALSVLLTAAFDNFDAAAGASLEELRHATTSATDPLGDVFQLLLVDASLSAKNVSHTPPPDWHATLEAQEQNVEAAANKFRNLTRDWLNAHRSDIDDPTWSAITAANDNYSDDVFRALENAKK